MEYKLIERLPFDDLTVQEIILTNRGIPLQDIDHYLHPTAADDLNPLLLDNMKTGAEMLIRHIYNNDDVWLIVDDDTDGFTSSAVLLNYLHNLFPKFVEDHIKYYIRAGKQHGIDADKVPNICSLVICPDGGSSDIEAHAALAARGVDILILDHHEVDVEVTNACLINNQTCDYPTKSLSGVGIVYKFCKYIDSLLHTDYATTQLDLVALGMIADVMSLRDIETHYLITQGLLNIQNPFFKAMVAKNSYSLGDDVTPFGVSFYISPYVNAVVRVGSITEKTVLFQSLLEHTAYDLVPSTKRGHKAGDMEAIVDQAIRMANNLKKKQTDIKNLQTETISKYIEDNNLLENKVLTICLPKEMSIEGPLVGYIANFLMDKYKRPTILLNEKDGDWVGSGRNSRNSKLTNMRGLLNDSNLVNWASGHKSAHGTSIPKENINNFISYCNEELKDFDFSPAYNVDFIFKGNQFNPNDILKIAELKPLWGQDMEEAYVAIENIRIEKDNITLLSRDKNPTLKISLANGVNLMKFKMDIDEFDKLVPETGCIFLNVVGTCNINAWNGMVTPQILIEDYEVTGTQKWVF